MKKLLLTGATGFVGKNVLPELTKCYEVLAPTRAELNLQDTQAVRHYLLKERCDVVLHAANPNPVKNTLDRDNEMLEASLRMFMNLYEARDLYGKMLYLGSGAEYDKRRDLSAVTEEQVGQSFPKEAYGFSKYVMNALARTTENIYNLRLFACFGPYDHASKFITHAIRCCLQNHPITIRQDCAFDYIHAEDLAKIVCWFVDHTPWYHDYNVCSGESLFLSQIAKEVASQMRPIDDVEVVCLTKGYNKAYTGSAARLLSEVEGFKFMPIEEGIRKQIIWERGGSW